MSVRITGATGPYALYDSTTGLAFGPTFESTDDAESFLAYLSRRVHHDARTLSALRLSTLYAEWCAEAFDTQGERHA